ncbi:Fasciclin-like arabinogalactan-protein-like [Rhynchospora pubera]|uniref:Fasciclin-like arabinogalactan-protein-like n=2 Tax=Rhynchospora pubera TaxID=906938 RepID=A0AAV8FLF6_9POAL|nr:Fasciclin-like arabinogalactan-protein-like [Rhynchospora pubera]
MVHYPNSLTKSSLPSDPHSHLITTPLSPTSLSLSHLRRRPCHILSLSLYTSNAGAIYRRTYTMSRPRQILLTLFLPLLLLSLSQTCRAHNITKILAQHPEFSQFNHYLTATRLASEINRRLTITVLAVDNSAMSALLARHFTLQTMRHVLSLHILVDYYGSKKLHQLSRSSTLSSSLFQATGAAPGTTGYVNITDHKKGHVTFSTEDLPDGASPATYVKSIKEFPYNLSVIQISSTLTSPEAEAPVPPPAPVNITELMYAKGCKAFADLLLATSDVETSFEDNIDGGLTIFCPIDSAVKSFMPKFKNLTAPHKSSILLYHGVPVYYSMQQLKSNNGVVNTLATGGGVKPTYTFAVKNAVDETVTLNTKVDEASIKAMIHDEDPLSIYSIDKFLQPKEMFKALLAPAPAPAPHKKKKKGKATADSSSDDDAYSPDSAPSDEDTADKNAAGRIAIEYTSVFSAILVAFAALLAF